MSGGYFVDWSEPEFPEIREAKFALNDEPTTTFFKAKQEVIKYYQNKILGARNEIRRVRALRASDVVVS